jgi:betaine-aldehyde dehydrogenase
VCKVSFTGSNATGKKVAGEMARQVKPCSLELGGKSALVVFDDCDIEDAVEWCMFGCFWTNGQICSATSRLILHEKIRDKFLRLLKERAQSIRIGDPKRKGCRLGPVVNDQQYIKIMHMIERAKSEGVEVLTGGGRPEGEECSKGYYISPTVFVQPPETSEIWQEEIFGPVLCVRTFSSEQEAISMANNSKYGLAAAVIGKDSDRCKRVAQGVHCGIVWVNCSQPCFVQLPWGGCKGSGYGRDLGTFGFESYLHVKQVVHYTSEKRWDWYPGKAKAKL